MAPKTSNLEPRCSPDCPRAIQLGAKVAPDPPTWSQNDLQDTQQGAKMTPRTSTWSKNCSQNATFILEPRWPPTRSENDPQITFHIVVMARQNKKSSGTNQVLLRQKRSSRAPSTFSTEELDNPIPGRRKPRSVYNTLKVVFFVFPHEYPDLGEPHEIRGHRVKARTT